MREVEGVYFAIISVELFSDRLPYYLDDYKDGIVGKNTIQKTVATTLFLYFSVILPAVALGVLNAKNTHDAISVQQVMSTPR